MTPMPRFCYDYPRPALTVDAVIIAFIKTELKVLLIKRADEPFKDYWAFPGGFVNEDETVEEAVQRELHEETGIQDISLEQFYTASTPGRDPRGWTISVIFLGFVTCQKWELKAGDDAKEAAWHPINYISELAFDHSEILKRALTQIKTKMRFLGLAKLLLEENFLENDFIRLGIQLGKQENELHQRLNRFIRAGLIFTSSETDHFHFNEERFERFK